MYAPATPVLIAVVLGYAQASLYPGFGLGPVEVLRRYSLVTMTAYLLIASLVFLLKLENTYSRVTLALALTLSLILVPLARQLALRLARRWSWWPEPVVIAGHGRHAALARAMLSGGRAEFRSVGVVDVEPAQSDDAWNEVTDREATSYRQRGVRIAIAAFSGPGAETAIDRLRMIFPRVIILREFHELPVEGVQVRNLGGILGLEYANNLLDRQSRWVKRTIDLAVGTVALLLAIPLILLASLLVKLMSPGPALFWQTREGRHGRLIRVPKIRTMVPDAERRMEELFMSDPALREEWTASFKLRRDPRIIPVIGVLFRRFSIDELPQLWSVVKGDMSLVGPRPFPHYHLDALSPQARHLRNEVRPGLTGLWQVTARGAADVEAQQAHDIYYIRNWSVWLDIYILAKTAGVVISGRGAY